MTMLLSLYLIISVAFFVFWTGIVMTERDEAERTRCARYAFASPLWPILTLLVLARTLRTLARAARGGDRYA